LNKNKKLQLVIRDFEGNYHLTKRKSIYFYWQPRTTVEILLTIVFHCYIAQKHVA